jgi:hypothetical protein
MTDCDALFNLVSLPRHVPSLVRTIERASHDTDASIVIFDESDRPLCGIQRLNSVTVTLKLTVKCDVEKPYEAFRDAVMCVANQLKGNS